MIREEYVTIEAAKLLKKAGFPQFPILPDGRSMGVPCIKCYRVDGFLTDWIYMRGNKKACSAPTQAQAMRWLREEKIISVEISSDENIDDWQVDAYDWRFDTPKPIKRLESYGYPSYEAAAEAGIQEACKYLIENQKEL